MLSPCPENASDLNVHVWITYRISKLQWWIIHGAPAPVARGP